jgi:hypothetical protein
MGILEVAGQTTVPFREPESLERIVIEEAN